MFTRYCILYLLDALNLMNFKKTYNQHKNITKCVYGTSHEARLKKTIISGEERTWNGYPP